MTSQPTLGAPVVFVGAAAWDAIALVDRFPEPDERLVADELRFAGGGPAATAAVACARLGVPAAFVGSVGGDDEGERIVADLRSHGVDTDGVVTSPQRRSGASVIVVDRGRGTRAICTRAVPPLDLAEHAAAAATVRAAPWVHVDHLGWEPVSAVLAGMRADDRPRLSVDAGNPIPGFSPVGVDLFAPTAGALADLFGHAPLEALLDAALAAGADTVVATCGADGSMAATAAGERSAVAGYKTDVVSTLGAGDVFHGALLAATLRGMPLGTRLGYANVAAALACQGLDGRSGIPTHTETLSHLPQLFGSPSSTWRHDP